MGWLQRLHWSTLRMADDPYILRFLKIIGMDQGRWPASRPFQTAARLQSPRPCYARSAIRTQAQMRRLVPHPARPFRSETTYCQIEQLRATFCLCVVRRAKPSARDCPQSEKRFVGLAADVDSRCAHLRLCNLVAEFGYHAGAPRLECQAKPVLNRTGDLRGSRWL